MVPVAVTSTITRVTCAAVTSGTPNCNTFAVIDISAMPPGAVARRRLGTGKPEIEASATPARAANASEIKILVSTPATYCGAPCRKLRSNRALFFFYSRNCLMSAEARATFVAPDLAPLPPA